MKKTTFIIAMFLALGIMFNACEKDDSMLMDKSTESYSLKDGEAEFLMPYPDDCEEVCIDLEDPLYYFIGDVSDTQTWGGGQNGGQSKTISYVAYNTHEKFIVEVTSVGQFNANATYTVYVSFEDEPMIANWTSAGSFAFEFDLPSDWDACDLVTFSVHQEGGNQPVNFVNVEYHLIGVCEEDCEEVFASAYAGNIRGENSGNAGEGFNNAWWYAFDITGDPVQDIYAGVGNKIGTATFKDGVITLDLELWWLQEGDETVKYYEYADGDLPTEGRPTPGHADFKGTSLEIPVNEGMQYYVIHLDVMTCR